MYAYEYARVSRGRKSTRRVHGGNLVIRGLTPELKISDKFVINIYFENK